MVAIRKIGSYLTMGLQSMKHIHQGSSMTGAIHDVQSEFCIPQSVLQAYHNISFKGDISVKYIPPEGKSVNVVLTKEFAQVKDELSKMAAEPNSWVNLPEKLLRENYIDTVYKTVDEFKKPFPADSKVMFVALGNPANADEAVNVLGYGHVVTYCSQPREGAVLQDIKKAGGDLSKIQVIISSKSGTTFETNDKTYVHLRNAFTKYYKNKGLSDQDVDNQVAKHFLCLTDKNPSATLKAEAIKRGYKTIDCVDGLPSGFGDLAYDLPLVAYAGATRTDAFKLINSAKSATKEFLTSPYESNLPAQMAAFDKAAIDNGAIKEQVIVHDSAVDLHHTYGQLYRESLRKVNLESNVYPRDAHEGLEPSISMNLPGQSVNNITNLVVEGADKNIEILENEQSHIINAAQEKHWQKNIEFKLNDDCSGITPNALGRFYALKSFLACFKNVFEGKNYDLYNISYVKGYKDIRTELGNARKALEDKN